MSSATELRPCRSPYCECEQGKCTHPGCYDARQAELEQAIAQPARGMVLPPKIQTGDAIQGVLQAIGIDGDVSYFAARDIWNACLDEVARLNACQGSADDNTPLVSGHAWGCRAVDDYNPGDCNCQPVSAGGMDERAEFEAWRLAKFCGGEERLKKCSNAPDVYYYTAEQEAWKVWQARAALAGRDAVPDAEAALRIQVCKLGRLGAAFDPPEIRYAYTYTEQPDNVGAMKLGRAAAINAAKKHGDEIDRGLHLLLQLQAEGFGVFQLAAPSAQQQGGGV